MISIRFWPVAALSAATLLGLAACSPAGAPYEPPPAPAPEAAPADDATSLAAPAAVEAIEEVHDHEEGHAGEAHVHGGGELAITREDDFLTVSLDAPLANFGLSEAKVPEGAKAERYAEGIVEPIGPTVCEETERSITGRTDGAHGAMTVSVVWRCRKIDRVEGMLVHVFELYPAFEHIDAIYLGPEGQQVAKELTPSDTEIDFD
ncbi:DUF2796 domain-containing protein [Hyphomonas sp. GM-8P]|uniref:ZrgA family zinc uptake protein n=1 Tax=Hyphomonas sp. GM-8P TaxID=1280945 RepID=UPI000DC045E7|nr:DUF2796 domain-containing protein [Hyphomonas sp. GM-8P]RAN39679.1 hypothetical protein HY26_15420 [Hyphomonas sp. GM-8P]